MKIGHACTDLYSSFDVLCGQTDGATLERDSVQAAITHSCPSEFRISGTTCGEVEVLLRQTVALPRLSSPCIILLDNTITSRYILFLCASCKFLPLSFSPMHSYIHTHARTHDSAYKRPVLKFIILLLLG